jgi:hypothetical protein
MSRALRRINPSESVRHLFAWTLRELRTQAGFSLQGFAKRLSKSDSYLSSVELAESRCTRSFAQDCDRLLAAQGKLINLWTQADAEWDLIARKPEPRGKSRVRPTRRDERSLLSPGGTVVVHLRDALGYAGLGWAAEAIMCGSSPEFDVLAPAADHCWVRIGERDVLMERRDFLTLLAFSTSLGIAPVRRALDPEQMDQLAASLRQPEVADPRAVDHLRRVLAEQRQLDDLLGPSTLLKPVVSQIEMLERVLRRAKAPVRDLLLPVAGEWAQFAWWLALDVRDVRLARTFYDKAVAWAHDGGDMRLGGYLLSCKSELAELDGDYEETRRLSEAAGRDEWHPTPNLKAWAAIRQAHADALLGDRQACDRQLGTAEELLSAGNSSDEPSYIYWLGPEYISGDRGMCYIELGLGTPAAEQIGQELAVLDDERERDRGWCLIRQGEAYVLAQEPEQAGAVAREAVAIAGATGSMRILEKARAVHRSMREQWQDLPATQELGEQLHEESPRSS